MYIVSYIALDWQLAFIDWAFSLYQMTKLNVFSACDLQNTDMNMLVVFIASLPFSTHVVDIGFYGKSSFRAKYIFCICGM